MEKIKILVACHKPGPVRHDDVYTPIHVGRAISKYKNEMSDMIGDDTGDNISDKNPFYSEMTAQYWAWKNLHDVEYIGFCHYRRFFNISNENIDKIFREKDVILLNYSRIEIVEKASRSITMEDMTIFLMVLKKMYPEYEQTTIDYLWGNKIHHKNMLICRKSLFDMYAEWIFSIFTECEKFIRLSPYSRGKRVYAYLAEIFMPVFFLHNNCRIKNVKAKGPDSGSRNVIIDFLWDYSKDVCFFVSNLLIKKPKSFEDYYDEAVLLGLKNDNIKI